MSVDPTISIIVPIYGVEKYIERCARSLFSQDDPSVEYVFVNDCTKDKSVEILKYVINDYSIDDNRIKIINHEENLGSGSSRLTGFDNSSGTYVWFIDSDDYISDYAILTLLPYLFQQYDLIMFSYYEEYIGFNKKYTNSRLTIERLLRTQIPSSLWKCIFCRSLLLDNDIKPAKGLNYAEDFNILAKALLVSRKKLELPDLYLYHYECSNQSSLMHKLSAKAYENCANAALGIFDFYDIQGAKNKYRFTLAAMLVKKYFDLYESDCTNQKLNLLLKGIRSLSIIYYILLVLHIPYRKQLTRLFKVITIGRDSNT